MKDHGIIHPIPLTRQLSSRYKDTAETLPRRYPDTPMVPTPAAAGLRVYNYIIIGSGTAGSLLASRLSKHSSVLLLESGNFATLPKSTPWLQIPLGYLYNMTNPLTSWNYKTSIKEANGKNREIRE